MKAGTLEIEIIAQIAKLQDDMRKVEQSVGGMANGVTKSTRAANDNIALVGQTGKLAGHHIQNLAFQFQDLAVQIGSGQNPLVAFLQQGSQISGVMMQAGVGVGGMVKQLGGMVGSFLLAHPAILAVGAAVAVGTFAFKGFADTLEKKAPVDDYIKSLGLTAEEAKKLTDTHVTLGDAAGAAWDMIKKGLGLDDVFKTLKGWVSDSAMWLYDQFKNSVASVYGAFKATYDNIGLLWKNLPALVGEGAKLAANLVITAVEKEINGIIQGLNWLAQKSNEIFGTAFGKMDAIDLSGWKLQYSAAGKEFGAAWSNSYDAARKDALAGFGRFEDAVIARRNARLKAQADEIIKDRKDKSTKATKDEADEAEKIYQQMMDARLKAQGNVQKLFADMVKRQQEWGKDEPTWGDKDKDARKAADDLAQAARENAEAAFAAMTAGFDKVIDRSQSAADAMANAFGRVGAAIGDVSALLVEYGKKQEAIDAQVALGLMSEADGRKATYRNQVKGFGAVAGAAKGLFKEHSAGYKAMAAAEKAFAIVQLAGTAIDVARGAAKMFSFLGPFAFPAVAAMMAVMASFGFKGGGGGKGSSFDLKSYQDAMGTGSVLGDSSAKSESIGRSLELMTANSDKELEYSNAMVRSLRAIENNIGSLSSLLAKQLGITGGAFDTSGLGLGSNTSLTGLMGGVFGAVSKIPVIGGLLGGIGKALFGTTVTKTLLDQGIVFNPETVQSILQGGIDGQTYQDIATKKKKKFLGVTTSNKTKTSTSYGVLDSGVEDQIGLLIGSMRDGILSAANVLGIEGAGAVLDAFKVDLGKISLKDLTGTEIEEQLKAIFSKLGDDMAASAVANLDAFQKVGEGQFETLMRLAKDYQTIDVQMQSIGRTFGAVGASSVEAREALIDLFGSLDNLVDQTQFYRDNFLTEAEQIAPVMNAVSAELARLNLSGVDSIAAFKSVVNGIDLTTEAGRDLYASMMALAPGFSAVEKYQAAQAQAVADLAKTRASMEITLLEAMGKSTEALALRRQAELAAMDESLRPLQQQIYAAQDLAKATELSSQRQSMEITLLEAMGRSSEATALRRQAELEAMDASLRPLQMQIYAWQDLVTAQEAAAKKVSDAKDVLSAAYDREASALGDTASKFRDFAKIIGDFRTGLFASVPGGNGYAQARARFDNTASLARFGNEASLEAFTGDAQAYLDASRARAGSAVDYARDLARVAIAADQAQAGANGVASAADQQLAALKESVAQLIELDETVVSVAQAITDLQAAQAEADRLQRDMDKATNPVPELAEVNLNLVDMSEIIERLNSNQATTNSQIAALRSEMQAALISIASNTGESARILRRADRGDAVAVQVETA